MPQESQTDLNVSEADQRGPDRDQLPDISGNIVIITDDEESKVINIKGLHAVGLILPAAIAGLTGVELHVSNLEAGTYAKLAEGGEFTLDALKAVGSAFITEWNYLKIVYVGTATTGGEEIPLSFS